METGGVGKSKKRERRKKGEKEKRGGERRKGAAEGTKIQYNIGRENFWEGQLQPRVVSSTSSELEQIRPACLHKWRGCVN